MARPVATGKAAARARQGAGLPPAAVAGAADAGRPALAGLCAVAMALPLAVLGPATGPYDDPKAWALPLLVWLTALAWLIAARWRGPWPPWAGGGGARVVAIAACAYGAWWIVTTLASIAPGQSLLGNFGRGLGLLTFGSAILLFPLVRSECRAAGSVRALVDAVLLGSAPVCALALGQAIGWDLLPRGWDPAVAALRVRSTFGQHIFLGSYLAMVIPLAVARAEWALGEWRARPTPGPAGAVPRALALVAGAAWVSGAIAIIAIARGLPLAWWLLVPWGAAGGVAWSRWARAGAPRPATALGVALPAGLVALQMVVVLLSQARGAFLAMLAGLAVAVLAVLARRRARRTLRAVVAALALVVAGLVALNLPGTAERVRGVPLLERLSHIGDVRPGSPTWFRVQVWRGILDGWGRQIAGEEMIPGTSPRLRSAIGFGLETQLVTLDRLSLPWIGSFHTQSHGWTALYLVDRAHNVVLDHLVTGGVAAVALWAVLVAALLAAGIARIRRSASAAEAAVRVGALGAVVAHVVDGQVGIATPVPLALFWIAAALVSAGPWPAADAPAPAPLPRPRVPWAAAVAAATAAVVLVGWLETSWLLASLAYAAGTRSGMTGDMPAAAERFERAMALVPRLPLPREAAAYTALRMAGAEPDRVRRQGLLSRAEATLAEERRHGGGGATYWTLHAQVAFGQFRAGDAAKLGPSVGAFQQAAALRPTDGQLQAQLGWALLASGDAARARAAAERALEMLRGREAWLAWAVLARSAQALGDGGTAERAARRARDLAPAEAHAVVQEVLS